MNRLILASFVAACVHFVVVGQSKPPTQFLIKGRVIDENQQPVPGAMVFGYPEGLRGKVPAAKSDAKGNFSLVVFQSGSFELTASKVDENRPSSARPLYNPLGEFSSQTSVFENEPPPFVTIKLTPVSGVVSGQILDEETKLPIKDARIGLCRVEVPKYCQRFRIVNGNFRLLAPLVPFTMQVSAPAYRDWYAPDGQYPEPLQILPSSAKQLSVSLRGLTTEEAVAELKAPKIVSPTNGAVFDHYPRTTRLEWDPVPDAVTYTVEIDICQWQPGESQECVGPEPYQSTRNPPQSGIDSTSYLFQYVGAQPGRWRVWAVDLKGRAGAKSDWTVFIYKR